VPSFRDRSLKDRNKLKHVERDAVMIRHELFLSIPPGHLTLDHAWSRINISPRLAVIDISITDVVFGIEWRSPGEHRQKAYGHFHTRTVMTFYYAAKLFYGIYDCPKSVIIQTNYFDKFERPEREREREREREGGGIYLIFSVKLLKMSHER